MLACTATSVVLLRAEARAWSMASETLVTRSASELLALVSAVIYFPFFKVYEKQLLAQEKEEAQRMEEENQQVA